jgi:hypothetical protein
MSDERKPADAYREQQFGQHADRFTTECRIWREPERAIFRYREAGDAGNPRATVTVYKPDARTLLRLAFGFRPDADVSLNTSHFGHTVRQWLANTKIWLSECEDFGGGLRECGDLVGTEAVPVQLIADGNWGAIFEVDTDCKAVRARIDAGSPNEDGVLLVSAKWTGISEISDRDWGHARERMQVTISPNLTFALRDWGPVG